MPSQDRQEVCPGFGCLIFPRRSRSLPDCDRSVWAGGHTVTAARALLDLHVAVTEWSVTGRLPE